MDELPQAKLYLDDIKEIVEILVAPRSDGTEETVKFLTRTWECNTIEELERLGGRAREFEIHVTSNGRNSSLRMTARRTYLWLDCPELERWSKHGKIKAIFEGSSIRWKILLT